MDASGIGSDYTEVFWTDGTIERLQNWSVRRASSAHESPPARDRPADQSAKQNYLHRAELSRSCGGELARSAPRTGNFHEGDDLPFVGPNDDVMIPKGAEKLDWEVELAVVIGKKASYVTKDRALEYVAGYALHNDYSERSFQLERGGQWVKGKSADTFAPMVRFSPRAMKCLIRQICRCG